MNNKDRLNRLPGKQFYATALLASLLAAQSSPIYAGQNTQLGNIHLENAELTISQQQNKEIKGKVVDKSGEPLPGVSVVIKGTAIGTATDMDGNFTFKLPSDMENPLLQVSFIGMETIEMKIKDTNPLRIVLKESTAMMDEVVVTGMEVIKKEHMTGSASVVTAKDLRMQGITSIDRILEGMVAGLNSTTISGAPGTRAKIAVRGENNLSGNTEPLWIVDGLPLMSGVPVNNTGDYAGSIMQDGVGNIMPEDIESISILKDASAAAIYGARAANGVIIITTKKGFRSKTQVNYSGSYECAIAPVNRLDFMNASQKLQYEKSIIDNFGLEYADMTGRGGFLYKRMLNGYITPEKYRDELNRLSSYDTDWFGELFRTAHSHQQNLSVRGGSEELTYYTSISFQQKSGILKSNQYESAGILVKLDYRPFKHKNLIFALDVQANTRQNRDHASAVDPFKYAMFANPYERPYDDYGNYESDLSYLSNNYTTQTASGYVYDNFNIMRELNETRKKQSGVDAQITFNVRYEVLKGLTLESIFRKGISYNDEMREVNEKTYTSWSNEKFGRMVYKNGLLPSQFDNGELSESSGKNNNWSIRNQIDYSFDINKDHLFSFLVANEVMSKKFNSFGYTSPIYNAQYRITGIPVFDHQVDYESVKNAVASMFHTTEGQDRSVSFLGSMRYGYKDRYIFNFSYRADGADIIGDSNRFTPLWSTGLRYNLHKEKFFKNDIVTELSLRGSFGYTGNIDRTALPFSTISYGSDIYQGNRYVNHMTFPNPTVRWEKKREWNFGLDATFFDGRINFTADYYTNKTKDVLETVEVPSSTGRTPATDVRLNGGIVENKGLELYMNVRWINRSDLTFSTSVNISRNKNVIRKSQYSYDSYQEAVQSAPLKGGVININGHETGAIYGWKTNGVNPETGNPRYFLTEEGKRAYGKFLDGWDSYSEDKKNKYMGMIGDLTTVPDYVDFVRNDNELMKYFMPSMQYLGRSTPKYVGGFNTYLRYKGFEFTTNWTFKTGHLIPNFNDYQNAPRNMNAGQASIGYSSDLAVSATNREAKYLYYWQTPGDVTDVSRFVTSGNDYWASYCLSNNFSKGDYLRMTNLSLSYRFQSSELSRLGFKNMTIGVNARNLLTFSKYRGLDVGSGSAFTYPVSREFNIKLSVGF